MFKKDKKIEFRPRSPQFDILPPKPATTFIPEWYKKTPIAKESVLTAKRCVPIIDAMGAGYIIPVPTDVIWDWEKQPKPYSDASKTEIVSMHHLSQTDQFELSEEYDPQPYKWVSHWHVKTPPGYSTLFVHPINRTDLPFFSFTGFVDTDTHPLIVNYPFFIKKGFKGVIPKGTPMIQAIPVKREDWSMSIEDENEPYEFLKEYEVTNAPFGWYKRKYWHKKKYS
jgi:hypothetical protein